MAVDKSKDTGILNVLHATSEGGKIAHADEVFIDGYDDNTATGDITKDDNVESAIKKLDGKVGSNKTNVDNYTVNGKKISSNPVLTGRDANVSPDYYITGVTDTGIYTEDTIEVAIKKLDKKTNDIKGAKANVIEATDDISVTTNNNNKTQLYEADRAIDESKYISRGYKVLRPNPQQVDDGNGGKKTINLLTQDMINEPDTTYVIKYDFDCNGATINLPNNCTLDFKGGVISNGTLNLNYATVFNYHKEVFKGCTIIDGYELNTSCLETWTSADFAQVRIINFDKNTAITYSKVVNNTLKVINGNGYSLQLLNDDNIPNEEIYFLNVDGDITVSNLNIDSVAFNYDNYNSNNNRFFAFNIGHFYTATFNNVDSSYSFIGGIIKHYINDTSIVFDEGFTVNINNCNFKSECDFCIELIDRSTDYAKTKDKYTVNIDSSKFSSIMSKSYAPISIQINGTVNLNNCVFKGVYGNTNNIKNIELQCKECIANNITFYNSFFSDNKTIDVLGTLIANNVKVTDYRNDDTEAIPCKIDGFSKVRINNLHWSGRTHCILNNVEECVLTNVVVNKTSNSNALYFFHIDSPATAKLNIDGLKYTGNSDLSIGSTEDTNNIIGLNIVNESDFNIGFKNDNNIGKGIYDYLNSKWIKKNTIDYSNVTNTPTFKTINGQTITGSGDITIQGGNGNYTLPAATTTTLGGVKVGANLSVAEDGTISANKQFSGSYNDLTDKPTIPSAPEATYVYTKFVENKEGTNADNPKTDSGYIHLLPRNVSNYNYLLQFASNDASNELYFRSGKWIHNASPQYTVGDWHQIAFKTDLIWANITGKPTFSTVATSGSYNDLTDKPTIPAAQVQSDWNQTDTTKADYIKNKPTIPSATTIPDNINRLAGITQLTNTVQITGDMNRIIFAELSSSAGNYDFDVITTVLKAGQEYQVFIHNKGTGSITINLEAPDRNAKLINLGDASLDLSGGDWAEVNVVANPDSTVYLCRGTSSKFS